MQRKKSGPTHQTTMQAAGAGAWVCVCVLSRVCVDYNFTDHPWRRYATTLCFVLLYGTSFQGSSNKLCKKKDKQTMRGREAENPCSLPPSWVRCLYNFSRAVAPVSNYRPTGHCWTISFTVSGSSFFVRFRSLSLSLSLSLACLLLWCKQRKIIKQNAPYPGGNGKNRSGTVGKPWAPSSEKEKGDTRWARSRNQGALARASVASGDSPGKMPICNKCNFVPKCRVSMVGVFFFSCPVVVCRLLLFVCVAFWVS